MSKYLDIEEGKIPDDYKNHFLSHFGFYDDNRMRLGHTQLMKYYIPEIDTKL